MAALVIPPFAWEGLSLRAWGPDDLDALAQLVTDPEVMARVGGALRPDEVPGLLDRYLRPDDPRVLAALAVWLEPGALVGSGLLLRPAGEPGAIEIGFLIARAHQGRGHGSRVARALVRTARAHGERVIATVDEDHAASIRVLEKAGLRRVGRRADAAGPYLVYEAVPPARSPGQP